SSSPINLSGYSLQYAPSTGSFSSILSLSGTIYSHTYYLIQLSSNNTSVGSDLPVTPNISGSINMAASSGKVALAGKTTSISGSSDPDVIDFLGYGAADDYEGSAASGLSNTTSLRRNNYIDTDDNASDFSSITANLSYLSEGLEVVSISVTNLARYYEVSDPLVIGNAKVVLYHNNGSTEQIDLTSGMVSGFSTSALGTYAMTITYQGLTTEFEYYVIDYSAIDEVLVHYIDLGYLGGGPGESALIQIGGIDILIDAGENSTSSKNALLAFLEDVITDGVIEYVIATHQDADHIGGMDVVYAAYDVENTILYSTPSSIATSLRNSFEAIVEDEEGTIYYVYDIVSESGIIDLTHGVSMVFYDTSYLMAADANASSIVFVLEAFNTRILFNGDAEGNQETVYAPLVGDVDIFKMGHHGAAAGTTANLLNTISPEVAIVNNGNYLGNQFSHPTYAALSRIYTYSNLVSVYSVTGGNGSSSDRMEERNGSITVTVTPSGYAIASEYYGENPLELSATAYWQDYSNPYRTLGYYYADATGLSEEAEIRYALNQIISGHTSISYTSLIAPMQSIFEDPDNSSNILLFYTNRSQSKYTNGGNVDEWNREHVWAQSHGIDGAAPAYSDLHHIRPTDVSVNSARGDLDFGVVSPHNSTTLVVDTYGDVLTYNYRNASYFEPRDEIKGDVARILFYMVVRYEGYGSEPDLELVNGITSSTSDNLGDLATLLLWHVMDPVDDAEREINHRIYQYQNNRNPFIDHPEWVDLVFPSGGSS
ncbi:MAG: endonuclease, partial [Candidatus Izemoplasmatales bacterium]|nr:endonuclease [Candidatus Izemoplasmatales bacterium]